MISKIDTLKTAIIGAGIRRGVGLGTADIDAVVALCSMNWYGYSAACRIADMAVKVFGERRATVVAKVDLFFS